MEALVPIHIVPTLRELSKNKNNKTMRQTKLCQGVR